MRMRRLVKNILAVLLLPAGVLPQDRVIPAINEVEPWQQVGQQRCEFTGQFSPFFRLVGVKLARDFQLLFATHRIATPQESLPQWISFPVANTIVFF